MVALDIEVLADRLDRLEAENRALRAELDELRAGGEPGAVEAVDGPVTRRALFGRLAGAAAAGGVAAIAGTTIGAAPAAADHVGGFGHLTDMGTAQTLIYGVVTGSTTRDSTLFGARNNAAGSTGIYGIRRNPSGVETFAGVVGDSDDGPGVAGVSSADAGVVGISAQFAGVYGHSGEPNDSFGTIAGVRGDGNNTTGVLGTSLGGVGVTGTSESFAGVEAQGPMFGVVAFGRSGIGIQAQGGSAPAWFVPSDTAGAPSVESGFHHMGELFIDEAGVLWLNTGGGTPGTWVQNLTSGTNSLGTRSVLIRTSGTAEAVEARVDNTASTASALRAHTAGKGGAVSANLANAASTAAAVRAATAGTGAGVWGSSVGGRGGQFEGPRAQVRLVPGTAAAHPSSGQAGDLFVDSTKRLWFCKGGTSWHQLV